MEDGAIEAETLLHPMEEEHKESGGDDKKESKVERGEVDDDQSRSSGLISHILSNLVSPKGQAEEVEEKEGIHPVEEKREEKGGGLLGHLISNLASPRSPRAGGAINGEQKVDVFSSPRSGKTNDGDAEKGKEKEEESVNVGEEKGKEEGGGGIIGTIVSNFPTSLPDDAVPTTDEASILIHAIVHD
ncbi:hypothetical protein Tsubulata_017891 [Turnera subulata]|uniref:Uncharacterized protein n=1 Tax=Turnera subulata TaxID=218843 RepID=A0A9Q0J093_9ROSI|nr:hypothetical protein Tsubulata_017891 [Turnera subulata]